MFYNFLFFFHMLLRRLLRGHWLGYATPEPRLPNGCHDLDLCIFKHCYNLRKGWPDVRVWIPAPCHDLPENRQTVMGQEWANIPVDNRKCCLYCCHVLKWKHACDELPQDNPEAIYVHLLCVWPMLDHFPAQIKKV